MKKIAASLLLGFALGSALGQTEASLLEAPDRIAWPAGGLYDGRFEDGTPFQIELAYPRPAALGDRVPALSESYWYPRQLQAEPFKLAATARAADKLELVLQANPNAAVDERFAITLAPDKLSGHGTWTSTRLRKTLAFTLQRAVVYDGVVVQRPAPDAARKDDPQRRFVFAATFPVLDDVDADAWIREQAGVCRDDLECLNEVRVRWKSRALLSLSASVWGYTYPGAHGNGRSVTRQYQVDDGKLVPLALDAFIDPDAGCTTRVTATIVAKLHAGEYVLADEWARQDPLAKGWTRFTPTAHGIVFRFDPYEVGPYAQGAPAVFLSRAELGSCLTMLPAGD